MKPLACALSCVMLLCPSARAAEDDGPASPRDANAEQRVSVSLTNRAGLVDAPFVTTAFPEVSGFGDALTLGAAVRWPALGWVRARLPISFVRLDFPAGAQVSETALANLELKLEHPLELDTSTRLSFSVAFVAPSAEHGPKAALLDNRALALADALSGGRDSALFTPGVTGLRLGASVTQALFPFDLRASLDLALLARISDASLPEETQAHALGIVPVLDLKAAWWAASWFGVSLGGALITEPLRVREPARERDRSRRLQIVLEPGIHFRLGRHVVLGVDAGVPVGGNLGGDAWSVGLVGGVGF